MFLRTADEDPNLIPVSGNIEVTDAHVTVDAGEAAAEVGAGGALGMPQSFAWDGQRGVRPEDLARGKRRAQCFGRARPVAEEGQLKTDVRLRRVQCAGDIPPFGTKIRVATMVARSATFGPGTCVKAGVASVTRPGTGTVRSKLAGTTSILPSAIDQTPSSDSTWRDAPSAANAPAVAPSQNAKWI